MSENDKAALVHLTDKFCQSCEMVRLDRLVRDANNYDVNIRVLWNVRFQIVQTFERPEHADDPAIRTTELHLTVLNFVIRHGIHSFGCVAQGHS